MILSKRAEIERFLSAPGGDIRAALIYGRDRGVVRERADALAKKATDDLNDPFNVALLNDSDVASDGARLEGELSALSMTGGRRLVRLRLFGEKSAGDKPAAEALAKHLEGALNPDCFFLIEAGGLDRTSAIRSAAEKAKAGVVAIPCYEDEVGDLARMTREALAKDKVGISNEALEIFVARLPAERGVARQEIERLALYAGPGASAVVGPDDLIGFLGVEPEASLFEAATDAFGGRMGAAQLALRRAAAEGEGGIPAIRAISGHAHRLRKALTLMGQGIGAQDAAKSVGVFWKAEREFLRQARAWTLAQLDQVQPEVLAADKACKTAGAPEQLIAERLALTIAGKARRLGL